MNIIFVLYVVRRRHSHRRDIYSTVDPEGDLDGTASEAFEILRADRHGRSVHRRVDLFFHAPDDESFERGQPRSGQIERRAFTFGDPFDVAVERRLADNLYVFYRRNGRGGGTRMRRDGNRAARRRIGNNQKIAQNAYARKARNRIGNRLIGRGGRNRGAASVVFFVGSLIVVGPLGYGLARVMTDRVRSKERIELGDTFKGFTENFGGSLILGLLQSIFIALWSLLLVVPGIVKAYSYSMSYYIQQEDKSKDWKACLDESRQMMDGYKGRLFCLDLSFIGWYIVGALCFGVGTLFVAPYHRMARANFFMALSAERETVVNA